MTDITPIVSAVCVIIGAIITTFVIPYIKSKTTGAQQEQLTKWIRIFVNAAEQLYGAGMGEKKLEYVAQALKANGIDVDISDTTDSIRAMIEAAVRELSE